MKQFIRENPTLAFGLGLPLLLVVVFALAAEFSTLNTQPPQYSVLYTVGNYNYQTGLQVHVVDKKVAVDYIGDDERANTTRLFLYNPVQKSLHEVRITLPPELTHGAALKLYKGGEKTSRTVTHLDVPELAKLTVDNAAESPDGYSLTADNYASGGGLLGELFIGSRYHNNLVLRKGNYILRIQDGQNYYNNPQVVGWVIPQ